LDESTLIEAKRIRMERDELLPESLPERLEDGTAILKNSVYIIDEFLKHYKEGSDGKNFRYIDRTKIKHVSQAKRVKQSILKDAAFQLEWILSDEIPQRSTGITFREVCDAQGVKDIPSFRQTFLDCIFAGTHKNALEMLQSYLSWEEQNELYYENSNV
jgi:hypothetical protein